IDDFYDEYGELRTDTKARGRDYIAIEAGPHTWDVRQILADPPLTPAGAIEAEVDVVASDEAGDIVLRIVSGAEIGVGRRAPGQGAADVGLAPANPQCQCRVIQWSGDESQ